MKRLATVILAGTALALVAGLPPARAQSGQFFAYKPPARGAPSAASRVGGGTRGPEQQALALNAVAPDHVGTTLEAQPTLVWFTSERLEKPVELVVVDEPGVHPVLELTLPPPHAAGFHVLSLAEHGARLEPGVRYQWYVALVVDPQHRSQDVITGGDIERVAPPPDLRARLAGADPAERTALLAEAGVWYDAVASLAARIRARPGDPVLREQRARLLAQVGLAEAADFARREPG